MRSAIFYFTCIYNSLLDVIDDDEVIESVRNIDCENYFNVFYTIESFLEEIVLIEPRNEADEIFLKLCKSSLEVFEFVFDSVINGVYEKPLIKLILDTNVKNCRNENISLYSTLSVHFTSSIQCIFFIILNEKNVIKDYKKWYNYFLSFIDEDIMESYTSIYFDEDKNLKEDRGYQLCSAYCMMLILQLNVDLSEKYIKYISSSPYFSQNSLNFNYINNNLELKYFKTSYYEIINAMIDELRDIFYISEYTKYYYHHSLDNLTFYRKHFLDCEEKFYFLLHPNGFSYNRICKIDFLNLYIGENFKTFRKYDNSTTPRLDKEYDMGYLEGKKLILGTDKEYEYVMGLLQYHSELYNKHIIVVVERFTFNIEIIKASYAPIDEILEYYKYKNDITSEIINDIKNNEIKYKNMYFQTIVENIEYVFVKKEGYKTVYSKCLRLNCSHIIGNELLEEYYNNFSERCYWCNLIVDVEAYFELNLYKKE